MPIPKYTDPGEQTMHEHCMKGRNMTENVALDVRQNGNRVPTLSSSVPHNWKQIVENHSLIERPSKYLRSKSGYIVLLASYPCPFPAL
jgi:hypothetical protein